MLQQRSFYIKCTLKTVNGFEYFATFYIGNDRDFAEAIFRKLKGNHEVNEHNILQLDFVESKQNLPVNLKMIHCNLDEMAQNSRMITKEMFKYYNLP
jgi:hypothetical protein